jgi:putative serine protease PepD
MRKLSRWIPVIGGAVAGGVIALVIASGHSSTTRNVTTTVTTQASARAVPTAFSNSGGMSINQIYKAASPGVVDIVVTTTSQSPSLGLFGGGGSGGSQKSEAEGAGVVYNSKGDILTDQHVVAGATSVKVTLQDGKQYPAKVLGTDASTDVGVIHIDAPSSELHPITFANSTDAQVGDPVVAIGSPFSLPETTRSRPTTRRPVARARARASGSRSRPTRSPGSPTRSSPDRRSSTRSSASCSGTAPVARLRSAGCSRTPRRRPRAWSPVTWSPPSTARRSTPPTN